MSKKTINVLIHHRHKFLDEFHVLHSSIHILTLRSRKIRRVEHVVHMVTTKNTHIWVRKLEEKRSLKNSRSRLEDNIKMNVKEPEFGCVNSIHLSQDMVQ
jgi:hypothetical protein